MATEGEASNKKDEVTNGLARFWLTILKVWKKKKCKLINQLKFEPVHVEFN